jgi:glucosylceramidase
VIEWNLAADPNSNPHTDRGGCSTCMGGITIDKDQVIRNPAYYVVAHAAKFVRPGSVRIASNMVSELPNVAFRTPDHKVILIVINTGNATKSFNMNYNGRKAKAELKGGSVATYVW